MMLLLYLLHCCCLADRPILRPSLRVHSHRHECESEFPYTGSSKHEFACISMAAVYIDTSSVRSVRVTCEFHSYEQFLRRSVLCNPYEVNNTKFVLI